MHSRRTLLRARFGAVRRDLDENLERMSPDMLSWAPAEGMRTLSGQLVEIIGTEIQLLARLREDRGISDPEARVLIGDCDSLLNLGEALRRVRAETLGYLDSLSDAELDEEVEFGGGWFGSLGLDTIPRAEVLLSIADHEWYHVGQITSYLWARGIDPYG